MRCEVFVAIWLRAREDIAANRFQLLFINIDTVYTYMHKFYANLHN